MTVLFGAIIVAAHYQTVRRIATPWRVKATYFSEASREVAVTPVLVMVAGPACTKNLPKEGEPVGGASGVTLLLSRITQPPFDSPDFASLHESFKPGDGCFPKPASCQIVKQRVRLPPGIFFVTLQCPCTFPLRVAVRAGNGGIRDFQELLTRNDFDLLCPHCASRHYGK